MHRASERRQQRGAGVALGRIHLGLVEKDALGDVGTSEVGADNAANPQAGTSEVCPDEVGPPVVFFAPDVGSH